MARSRYRRIARRPAVVELQPPVEAPDFSALKKDELVEAAKADGVDASGTKAEIIERLEAAQAAVEAAD